MSHTNSKPRSDDPLRFQWAVHDYDHFQVEVSDEITVSKADIIYHFWPPGEAQDFHPAFGAVLQSVFQEAFKSQPKDEEGFPKVDIQADYTAYGDSQIILDHGGTIPVKASLVDDQEVRALSTFYVRVVGWASNPAADLLLKTRLFQTLDTRMTEITHVPQEDLEPTGPADRPERDHPRRRRRRRRNQR